MQIVTQPITLDTFNLASNERRLCVETLALTGSIVGAAQILGITRHALKRRIIKLGIGYTRGAPAPVLQTPTLQAPVLPAQSLTL